MGPSLLPRSPRQWLSVPAPAFGRRHGGGAVLIYLLDTARKKNAEARRATDQHYSRETIPSPPLHPPERLQGDRGARGRVLRALIVLIVSDWGPAELGHREKWQHQYLQLGCLSAAEVLGGKFKETQVERLAN